MEPGPQLCLVSMVSVLSVGQAGQLRLPRFKKLSSDLHPGCELEPVINLSVPQFS